MHIAETLPSLLEPDNTGVRKQYGNNEKAVQILNWICIVSQIYKEAVADTRLNEMS